MEIKEFINNNYNYISAIATNEYNKEKNKVLYKNYDVNDFISEVMLFFIKKYDVFDESLCKPRTFIIQNCGFCSGELKAKLNKSNKMKIVKYGSCMIEQPYKITERVYFK